MKKLFFILIVSVFIRLFAQNPSNFPSSISIANTSVSDTKSISAFSNPSLMGYIDKTTIGIGYENRFLLSQLATKSIYGVLPSQYVKTGLSFSYFGYSLYHEMQLGVGFARNFSDKFSLGLQFNYLSTFFNASNKYSGAFLPQIGFNVFFTPEFSMGINVYNPFQTNINTDYSYKIIPSIYSIGTQYYFTSELVWRCQIDKEIGSNYRFATGFEYMMLKNFTIKLGGYGSDYFVPCLGFATQLKSIGLGLNAELHPLLGLNTNAMLFYTFKN